MGARTAALCCCLCLLAALQGAFSQQDYSYSDDLNYYDDYELYSAGYHYDMYDETKDEGTYFNPYTGYYDDVYGDYVFDDSEEVEQDCRLGDDGKPVFNGTAPCDVKVEGADKHAGNMKGGLDGTYKVTSCENGRPLYKREDSPANEERVLWYSAQFRDWDVSNGTLPREDDILMYGGGGTREARPQYVVNEWSVASDFQKDFAGSEDYVRAEVTVTCADGTTTELPKKSNFGKTPLLTDDEMEAQYKAVYQRARGRSDASADVNLGLVTLFVMVGLGVVFGLPYLVARNRRARRGKQDQGGLSSIMEAARKRGHAA